MIKLAFYGKGGIGKSTTVSNIAFCLARKGYKVMQIGCDPKADSTSLLTGGKKAPTLLELFRESPDSANADEAVVIGNGVVCLESGGPVPGSGCAGRGIITALEMVQRSGLYEKYNPDVVFFDVPGDVVCGGFAMPMRRGFADRVYILTSGENMAIYAAANIATALESFKSRGYAALGGIIVNRRGARNEDEKVKELSEDFNTKIIGFIDCSEDVLDADDARMPVAAMRPESSAAKQYEALAEAIAKENGL